MPGAFLRVFLFTALLQLGPALIAVSAPGPSQREMPQEEPQAAQPDTQERRTFTGKIVKSGEKLVLYDKTHKTSYQLDDQQWAQLFLGENVTVTGALDARDNTIFMFSVAVPKGNHSS
jgi:hypothetical protein